MAYDVFRGKAPVSTAEKRRRWPLLSQQDGGCVNAMTQINNPFIALRHANYRFYAIGMLVSMIGSWMQNIAQPWLAYRLTGSPFLLSLVGALQFMPVLLFSLPAGVLIDRIPRKKILIITQSASVFITLLLAILAWRNQIQYWQLLLLATLQGFVNTLDMPTRQAFVVELVGREDLMNAIALNSTIFNLSRVIGPAMAGMIMAATGVAVCFLINAVSFAAVLFSLCFIHPLPVSRLHAVRPRAMDNIRAGLHYIRGNQTLVETLILIAIIGTFVPNFSVSVPIFTTEILKLDESGFGFLMAFLGIGSLAGALYIAAISRSGPSRRIMHGMPLVICLFLTLAGFTRVFALTALTLALTGFFFVAFASNANSTLQITASDEFRGRVMSVYSLIFGGSTPIGNLYTGFMIERFNARLGFIACGVIMVVLLALNSLFNRRRLRTSLPSAISAD